MRLFATVLEDTVERAIETIQALTADHDGIEVRAERFPVMDSVAIRQSTAKPIVLTIRNEPGRPARRDGVDAAAAFAAGIDLVDVEWRDDVQIAVPERTVLSHHDYSGLNDIHRILGAMRARGCAHTKLAATPRTFDDNLRLLELTRHPSTSVIGMGERGLYSRILAPFRGSELTFVAASVAAAPGQLSLGGALEIYGPQRETLRADRVFAVVGNPAGHSRSPAIHNRLFREKGVSGAYTIASIERFEEITDAFRSGEPAGLSVTAPFKQEAFAFAIECNAEIGENARRSRAVNTLVRLRDHVFADNTDVDGFEMLLPRARMAAVIGAGGTARAALVALERLSIPATVFNRTLSRGDAPLEALAASGADLIINTLPSGVDVDIPPCDTYIEAAYGGRVLEVESRRRIGGIELLQAQAARQHELFMRVFEERKT